MLASSDSHRVAVTAAGCVSALGVGVPSNFSGLRENRSGVRAVDRFDVSNCRSKTAGAVDDVALADAAWSAGLPRSRGRASRLFTSALAEALAARPGFEPELAIIGTTSGGMPLGEAFYRAVTRRGKSFDSARRRLREYLPQQPVVDALQACGIGAPVRIFSNACASGTNAVGHAFRLVRSGAARRMVCGGYDVLCELVFAGFDALQASTPDVCRPFDEARNGLVLGEGAAVLFLERFDDAVASGLPILAELTGYGSATDNYHLTQPNPDGSGPRIAMERALADAGCVSSDVDYVNAHGTATPFNDACEALAIAAVCPGAAVSSTKAQIGHTLGAAGAIEAVFSVLALQGEFLPANLNFERADKGVGLDIVGNMQRQMRARRVVSNSLGFGGANASLVIERAG